MARVTPQTNYFSIILCVHILVFEYQMQVYDRNPSTVSFLRTLFIYIHAHTYKYIYKKRRTFKVRPFCVLIYRSRKNFGPMQGAPIQIG